MAALSSSITTARNLLGVTSTDLSDSLAISLANVGFDDIQLDLFLKNPDIFVEKSTLQSISNGQSVIPLEDDLVFLKRVEVNFYDPTDATKFKVAREFDASVFKDHSWEWYLENQPKDNPLVDVRGGYAEIAPKADADYTNAIKIIYAAKLQAKNSGGTDIGLQFQNTTDLLPYPLSIFPSIIAFKICQYYVLKQGKTASVMNKAANWENIYNNTMAKMLRALKSTQETFQAESVSIDTRSFLRS